MPARRSAAIVVFTPCWPASSEWFDAVLHASHPVERMALARDGGVRKLGYPCTGPGTSGVSTWQSARSAPAMRRRIGRKIGPKSWRRPPPSASACAATGVWIRKSPLAATVKCTGGAGASCDAHITPMAASAAVTSSPAHVVPLHHPVPGLELEASRKEPGEGAEGLAVVAAEGSAPGVVLACAPLGEAELADPGQVLRERLRRDLPRLSVDPHGALARLARIVNSFHEVPGHGLAAKRPADSRRPAPPGVARVVAGRVVHEAERPVDRPLPPTGHYPAAHRHAGLLAGPDPSGSVRRHDLHAVTLVQGELDADLRLGDQDPARRPAAVDAARGGPLEQ